jgi:hypothetical protein
VCGGLGRTVSTCNYTISLKPKCELQTEKASYVHYSYLVINRPVRTSEYQKEKKKKRKKKKKKRKKKKKCLLQNTPI